MPMSHAVSPCGFVMLSCTASRCLHQQGCGLSHVMFALFAILHACRWLPWQGVFMRVSAMLHRSFWGRWLCSLAQS
jgi:hypothetical protein